MSTAPLQVPLLQPQASLPAQLRAGDHLSWALTAPQIVAPGTWLFYVLTGVVANTPVRYFIAQPTGSPLAGGVQVSAAGIAAFALTSAATAAWQPGRYQWILFALDAQGNRNEVAQGEIRIEPNPLAATPADPRGYNERLLAQIRALLLEKALDDVQMFKIGGRELTKLTPDELERWHGIVEARARREYRKRTGKSMNRTAPLIFGGRP